MLYNIIKEVRDWDREVHKKEPHCNEVFCIIAFLFILIGDQARSDIQQCLNIKKAVPYSNGILMFV